MGVYHTLLKIKSFDSLVFTQKTKVDLLNVKIYAKRVETGALQVDFTEIADEQTQKYTYHFLILLSFASFIFQTRT